MSYVLLFPGQGSQTVGMLKALGDAHAEVAHTFEEASTALGYDLAALVREGPKEMLDRTENTQPALLAASIAVWRVWCSQGAPPPVALAGHSLGEYSALVAAGSIAFADALKLVRLRGQLMQAAVPEGQGGMAAVIGLDDSAVAALCKAYPGEELIAPANFNSPGQVVVAGETPAIEWLLANGKAQGARMVMRVGMSVPSHCSLLAGAAQQLASALRDVAVSAPNIPVLHNLDAAARSAPDEIRAALAAQLHQPVQWTRTINALAAQGVTHWLECGPGKVLTGLVKRSVEGAVMAALEDPVALAASAASMKEAQ
ncbi:MAG: ACP S-malonyltransferase [Pseudomonadota bacterium]